jgi:hypothetical protein
MSLRWVKCPRDGHVWETRSRLVHATCSSCGYKINIEENLVDPKDLMEHFNLDENGVKVLDKSLATERSPSGRLVDLYFKDNKVWCNYDDSFDCKHIEYALSLPLVQEILKQKGWKVR